MATGPNWATQEESVVLATFDSRQAAERMLASLGRDCRQKARDGEMAALVISANRDGSLQLARAGVLTSKGWMIAVIRLSLAVLVGVLRLRSIFTGGKSGGRAVRSHKESGGSDGASVYAMLAQLNPQAGVALVICRDEDARRAVAARAGGKAIDTWDGSRSEFLADLDPDDQNDWVRNAVVELLGTKQLGGSEHPENGRALGH